MYTMHYIFEYLHPMTFACIEVLENCSKYIPMKYTGHVTEKLDIDFFMGFHRLCINTFYKD